MATFAASDIEPLVILTGSPEEADRFLMSALWGDSDTFVSVLGVLGWANVLRERGSDFASHAAACHYWLYERAANVPAVLLAWKRERNARNAASRSIVTLAQQQTLVDRLVFQGSDAVAATEILELMQQTFRVICDIWEVHAKALDSLLVTSELQYRHRHIVGGKRCYQAHECLPRPNAPLAEPLAADRNAA
jgi:hypothetical protein